MSNPYIGEIRMFGGDFAPSGWAFCDGSLMAISQDDALFQLIGTTYGGDGINTFALPDLRGRVPVHMGSGFVIGQKAGVESVTLTVNQIPAHSHLPLASSAGATATSPSNQVWANWGSAPYSINPPATAMDAGAIGTTGGGHAHDNMVPFLAVSFIISLFGIFPSQN